MITPVYLWASYDPKTVRSTGRLLDAPLVAGSPIRLFFDHVNWSEEPLRIVLLVRNLARAAGFLNVSAGYGAADYNGMDVGHEATREFLVSRSERSPATLPLPPGQAIVLRDIELEPFQCACGIVDLETDLPFGVDVNVLAVAVGDDPVISCKIAQPCAPDGSNRKGQFDISRVGDAALNFVVGGSPADFVIGDATLPNIMRDPAVRIPKQLAGELAVVKRATFALRNPTLSSAQITLTMQPHHGLSRATFSIDGIWFETEAARAGAVYRIYTIGLASGDSAVHEFITAPELNSSYPIRFRMDADRANIRDILVTRLT